MGTKKKEYVVTWTMHYNCTATVTAGSEDEAINAAYDAMNAGEHSGSLEGTSDWSARETGQGEP